MLYPIKLSTIRTFDDAQISALALAVGRCEWNGIDNSEWLHETVDNEFNHIDHEAALIDALNAWDGIAENRPALLEAWDFAPAIAHRDAKCPDLKLGAAFALWEEQRGLWSALVTEWTEKMSDERYECLGDYSHMPEPYASQLQEAYNSAEESAFNDYLYGDRSNEGLLDYASERVFGRVNGQAFRWSKFPEDALSVYLEDEPIRDYIEAASGNHAPELEAWLDANCPDFKANGEYHDKCPMPPADLFGASLSADIDHLGEVEHGEREAKLAARIEAIKAEDASRKERREKEEAERVAKLNAMKR